MSISLSPIASPTAVRFHQATFLNDAARIDARWPIIAAALRRLRDLGRRSVRIVDLACGSGQTLLRATRYARTLGFRAIEGRGRDDNAHQIARAWMAARVAGDPAIGLSFSTGDVRLILAEEADFPADILLCTASAQADAALTAAIPLAARWVIAGGRDNHEPARLEPAA